MDDPQQLFQLAQSVIIGIIFSFLLAKLIKIIISFREQNLSIVRDESVESESELELELELAGDTAAGLKEPLINDWVKDAEGNSDDYEEEEEDDDDDNDDSDWEGDDATELDEEFSAAATFVAAAASDRLFKEVSSEKQLQIYGLYKVATEGPCKVPQPSPLKMTARAKWQAWNKLGEMPAEEAMKKYIALVDELYPSWDMGANSKREPGDNKNAHNTENRGPMGPVFSTYVYEEDSQNELKMDAMHDFAREGEHDNLLKCLEDGASVNLKDSEGRTPLHWAVDRGHLNIVELLISKDADINAKDNEGQSALHYAAVCERETIAEFLVEHKADINLKDNDGSSPADLSESIWPWLIKGVSTSDGQNID